MGEVDDEPDWGELKRISAEMSAAIADGTWDQEKFEELLGRGEAALGGGDEDLLEFLYNEEGNW